MIRRVLYHPRFSAALAIAVSLCVACASAAQAPAPALSEKASRTPAQRKINSQLLYEIYRLQGKASEKSVPPGPTGVRIDAKQRAYVDIRAEVTPMLGKMIVELGGSVVSTASVDNSTLAWMPLLKLELLAEESAVTAIEPVPEAIAH